MSLVCYGSLAFPCGQLAACLNRWEEAEQYFDRAVEMNLRIGARPYLVRTRRAYASMLLDRDAPDDRSGFDIADAVVNSAGPRHHLGSAGSRPHIQLPALFDP